MNKHILPLLLIFPLTNIFAENAITLGPMVNVSFGNTIDVSYALEIAIWNIDNLAIDSDESGGIPYGIDFGIEWNSDYLALYTESQIGVGTMGISAGPAIIWTENTWEWSVQGTVWVNLYAGLAYRYRNSELLPNKHYGIAYVKGLFDSKMNWID